MSARGLKLELLNSEYNDAPSKEKERCTVDVLEKEEPDKTKKRYEYREQGGEEHDDEET